MKSGMAGNKKKIIIIGASGMLGQELAKAFYNEKLLLLDINEIDICQERQVIDIITKKQPDIVINAAAYNDVDDAEKNRVFAKKINGLAVRYLAKAINATKGILVHYSTDYVFDGVRKTGYFENNKPNPISAYGKSKLLGEKELIKFNQKYYLIRLSRLFGKAGKSRLAKNSFVDQMLSLGKIKKEIKVVDEELSCPTYAPDLAKQTKYIIDRRMPFGIYHVTNSASCTWYELAKEIFKIKNYKIKLNPVSSNFFPRIAKRPKYSILLNSKLPPLRNWQIALGEYLKLKI